MSTRDERYGADRRRRKEPSMIDFETLERWRAAHDHAVMKAIGEISTCFTEDHEYFISGTKRNMIAHWAFSCGAGYLLDVAQYALGDLGVREIRKSLRQFRDILKHESEDECPDEGDEEEYEEEFTMLSDEEEDDDDSCDLCDDTWRRRHNELDDDEDIMYM